MTSSGRSEATSFTVPEMSVVIPVRNGMPWLNSQIEALRHQRCGLAWELVIADNGSTDDTAAAVLAAAADFPVPVRLIDASARRGAAHARNEGARAALAAKLAFCDADDVVADDWVEAAAGALDASQVAVGLLVELSDPLDRSAPALNPGCLVGSSVLTGNLAVRRATYLQVGGFDTSFPPYGYEDTEFSVRLAKAGIAPSPAPDMVVHYRRGGSAWTRLKKVYRSGQAFVCLWQRHPEQVDGPLVGSRLWAGVISWPITALGLRSLRGRESLRTLVMRFGMLTGYYTWVRSGRLGPPQTLTDLSSENA